MMRNNLLRPLSFCYNTVMKSPISSSIYIFIEIHTIVSKWHTNLRLTMNVILNQKYIFIINVNILKKCVQMTTCVSVTQC